MTWHQHAMACADAYELGLTDEEHDECVAIACETDEQVSLDGVMLPAGHVAWVSHAPVEHAVSHRINPDVAATDWTQGS